MSERFDEKDAAILAERIAAWQAVQGPRVGDFCKLLDGTVRRFTHDWGDALQTTAELLAALKSLLAYDADGADQPLPGTREAEVIAAARAASAKAEGQS